MTAHADMSILSLVMNASVLVQLVMLLLLGISIASWTGIFRKGLSIREEKKRTHAFEEVFWTDVDLGALYRELQDENKQQRGALAQIFEAGMGEFLKVRQQKPGDVVAMLDGARRAMRASSQREMDSLERGLPFLASAGSVSPYIGLFGTVWGIMNAFRGLANVQQATLAAVAPGIAEALVATAIGLFAAIPAVVAYNRYATEIDRLANRFDTFSEEFLNILQRQAR
ncbi:MAG: protein TolQ [Betaproteobacteria bacterium]|nr:protein TolQ [Pseudomonadota bacterium]NBO11961.1 protein TolQ [Betaproteobacteria bacterium]NBO44045.1 protein TolQ [Betaproteobacteria bacterium]NBP10022.1 protein TolQ [Betaproteobacteria bacterium]NBS20918.1 protein TolQ [Betaproteobacteria bacterium]